MTEFHTIDLMQKLEQENPERHRILMLAALPKIDYDKQRITAAEILGIRASTLDEEVATARQATIGPNTDTGQGSAVTLQAPEPWTDSVDGNQLVTDLINILQDYLVVSDENLIAIAFWVIHAHCLDCFNHTPRLNVTAPEKACGKTLVLDLLLHLTPRAVRTENLSTAVMFRLMDAQRPTLIIDEYDTFLKYNDDLRGALNSGWQYGGQHMRCEGDGNEVRAFRTFGAVALAGIRGLPPTLHDRSIVIKMKRATRDEITKIKKFDSRRTGWLEDQNRKIARWALDHQVTISKSDPEMPESFYNRTADRWRPLFAIADCVGGTWPNRVRQVAISLESGEAQESNAVMLLQDIETILTNTDPITSAGLAEELIKLDDRPWGEYGKMQKPISKNSVARILKTFNIKPHQIRFGEKNLRGYESEQFADAFRRYVSQEIVVPSAEPLQPNKNMASSGFPTATHVADENTLQPNENEGCSGSAVGNGDLRGLGEEDLL